MGGTQSKTPTRLHAKPAVILEPRQHHETSDTYVGIIARLCARHRVVVCKDNIQWILQARRGERHGQPRWEGLRYIRTKDALIRVSHAICGRIDPSALAVLAALPDVIGRSA